MASCASLKLLTRIRFITLPSKKLHTIYTPTFLDRSNYQLCCRNTIFRTTLASTVVRVSHRNFSWRSLFSKSEHDVAVSDGVDTEQYAIVYKTQLASSVFASKILVIIVLSSSLVLIYKVLVDPESVDFSKTQFPASPMQIKGCIAAVICFFLCLIVFIHRTPIRMYHSIKKKNFLLVFHSLTAFGKTLKPCAEGEMNFIGSSTWNQINGCYSLRGQRIMMVENNFRVAAYYNKLLGYKDEPLKSQNEFK